MTPEQKQAIRERCERATPGPWAVGRPANSEREAPSIQTVENSGDKWWIASLAEARPRIDEDAAFIAAAREDVPALLEALEGAEAHVALLKASMRQMVANEERVRVLEEALREVESRCVNRDPLETEEKIRQIALAALNKPPEGSETP